MPFAIMNSKGEYFRVARQSYGRGRKRRWVASLDEATVWAQRGHASNAFVCAVENRAVPASTVVDIVEVALAVVRVVDRVTTRMKGKYRTHRKVVSVLDRGESSVDS